MANPPHSIFRNAIQVSPERIAQLNDADLSSLMRHLFHHQAYKCGSPQNEIRVNTEGDAADDGCDGWTAKPRDDDQWLGLKDTCWQLKAGSKGEPAALKGEVTKRIPHETLSKGGRFVVVAPGSKSGAKGEKRRRDTLTGEAKAASLPIDNVLVIGSERLANWCNENPAVAAYWAGRPDGLWTLDSWARSPEHQVAWHASDEVQKELEQFRTKLDFYAGDVVHLHLTGLPGVGKTRLALELCRKAPWCEAVIYIRQASDIRLLELITGAAADPMVQLLVVADEVQFDQLRPLRDSIDQGNGRIKLITIGHSESPDPSRIPAVHVRPLKENEMREILEAWHPDMPREHVDFVIRFADGYVRLAKMAADAVAKTPCMNVRELLSQAEIRRFLDGMLGPPEDRKPLYVVAALSTVGWTAELDAEGRAIAQHFSLNWNTVRESIQRFDDHYDIAPKGGRYRYISPTPLGIHLAVEAWTVWPDLMKSLPEVLPSDAAREAYYERLQSIASNPHARAYAKEELGFFCRLNDFVDETSARRWSALSSADPELAAESLLGAVKETSVDDRKQIAGGARREIVWTLVRLAWQSSAFHDATESLALLAEAENESWANNASGEFIAKYQVLLGGTALPYLDRLTVLDDLMQLERQSLARLVVKALGQVGLRQVSRSVDRPPTDEVPEEEWVPRTRGEHFACIEAAVNRLRDAAGRRIDGLQDDLIRAADQLSMMLRNREYRNVVFSFFTSVRDAYPESREPLRRIISHIITSERKYWQQLTEGDLDQLEELHAQFEDNSLSARLMQFVGTSRWDQASLPDLRPLAVELHASPTELVAQWQWLISGEASDVYRLGFELGEVDPSGDLDSLLSNLSTNGRDFRLLCGYVDSRRRVNGENWYDNWYKSQFERTPRPIELLLEVAWRCAPTEYVADCVIEMLNGKVSPQIVGPFRYLRWFELLWLPKLMALSRAMVATGHAETAIAILEQRLKVKPDEFEQWKELALGLVTSSELIRSTHASHHWKEIAIALVNEYSKEIASAIFREQANRNRETWFLEHSQAASVAQLCVEHDASGTWNALKPFLEDDSTARMFMIGFPKDVLVAMPHDQVLEWIATAPNKRAVTVADILPKDFSSDETLPSRIIGTYGDIKDVDDRFFMAYMSGAWHGDSSHHWEQLADELKSVASRTKLAKLKRWARHATQHFRGMAERDRDREAEEELRRR